MNELDFGFVDGDGPEFSGWTTYNFEVAAHHTYIADGIRVHNQSMIVNDGPVVRPDRGADPLGHDQWEEQRRLSDVPTKIRELSWGNPDSLERAYVNAVRVGDVSEIARAAMKLPGVYDDAILRSAAGYTQSNNDNNNDNNTRKSHDTRGKDQWDLPKPKPRTDHKGRTEDDPNFVGPRPIVLDLDNNGVRVTQLSEITVFMDATGDGYVNRTA